MKEVLMDKKLINWIFKDNYLNSDLRVEYKKIMEK